MRYSSCRNSSEFTALNNCSVLLMPVYRHHQHACSVFFFNLNTDDNHIEKRICQRGQSWWAKYILTSLILHQENAFLIFCCNAFLRMTVIGRRHSKSLTKPFKKSSYYLDYVFKIVLFNQRVYKLAIGHIADLVLI